MKKNSNPLPPARHVFFLIAADGSKWASSTVEEIVADIEAITKEENR